MDTNPTQPPYGGYSSTGGASSATPHSSQTSPVDPNFSTTAAHATGDTPYPTDRSGQPASGVQGKLNDALASGKKWLNDSGLGDKAQQLSKDAKDLGNKAVASVSGLTNTQKAVGAGLLAAGIAFLAIRGKKDHDDEGDYRRKPRRSPFDHQPHTKDGDHAYDRRGQRPWGSSRYGSGPAQGGKSRVSSGSGYSSSPAAGHSADHGRMPSDRSTRAGGGPRRDQGPASGSRYDARTSGSQNPNNLDDLNSAF